MFWDSWEHLQLILWARLNWRNEWPSYVWVNSAPSARQLYLTPLKYSGVAGEVCFGPAIVPDLTSLGSLGLSKLGQVFCTLGLSPMQSGVLVTYLGALWLVFGAAKGMGDIDSKKAKSVYETCKVRCARCLPSRCLQHFAGWVGSPNLVVPEISGRWRRSGSARSSVELWLDKPVFTFRPLLTTPGAGNGAMHFFLKWVAPSPT